jgi:hypothetical protein
MEVTTGAASVEELDSLDAGKDEGKGEQVSRDPGEDVGASRQLRTPGSREESDCHVPDQHLTPLRTKTVC